MSQTVQAGIAKLEASSAYREKRAALTLQEQLRPLFCETEINIESDPKAMVMSLMDTEIPSAFLINPFFTSTKFRVSNESFPHRVVPF